MHPETLRRNSKISLFAVIGLLCGSLLGNAAAASTPLAILTDASGSIAVQRGKQILKAGSGTRLFAGDVVYVRSGKATVYYVTQAPRALSAGQSATVGKAATGANSSGAWRNVYAGVSSGFSRQRSGRQGTVRGDRMILVSPVKTALLTNRPRLIWTKHARAVDYIVKVTDDQGVTIWQQTTPQTFIEYGPAPELQPDIEYHWDVTPRQKSATGTLEEATEEATPSTTFTVASPDTKKKVASERDEIRRSLVNAPSEICRNALAAMLAHHGLHGEAISTLAPEMFAPRIIAAGESVTALQNLLPNLNGSSRILLHNAFIATNQQQWARLIHVEPGTQEPDSQ